MATIGLVIRQDVPEALGLAERILTWATANQHEVILGEGIRNVHHLNSQSKSFKRLSAAELVKRADPIISLGGDGTLLGVARHVRGPSPTFIGVNFGQLGFLTEIAPAELIDTLDRFFAGKLQTTTRDLLNVQVSREGALKFDTYAVNDAVVAKGSRDPLLDLDVSVNEKLVMKLRADGLIVATPTGSTAYSLAAGGSIVLPPASVTLVTPLSPHSLTARPMVLPSELKVSVKLGRFNGEVWLTVDGQENFALQEGDQVVVSRAENPAKFLCSPRLSYFEILRTKLNWGRENQPK